MKKETKMYWKLLCASIWDGLKQPLFFIWVLTISSSWLPGIVWCTDFFAESNPADKIFGTLAWAVGSLCITMFVVIQGDNIWKAWKKHSNSIKKKVKAQQKKEQTVIDRKKQKAQAQQTRREKAVQDECDCTGMSTSIMGGSDNREWRPRTTKAQRVIMEANGIGTYEALIAFELQNSLNQRYKVKKTKAIRKPKATKKKITISSQRSNGALGRLGSVDA